MARPPKYKTLTELEDKVNEYFAKTDDELLSQLSITGLALHLGFESRQSLYDYEKNKMFSYTIKRARLRIENFYELCLTGRNPAGSIFALKNFGWTDKQQIEHSGGVKLIKDDID